MSWLSIFGNSDWALSPVIHAPTQLVAPSAVRIAVAIEAINCTINFAVSFLLIIQIFKGLKI